MTKRGGGGVWRWPKPLEPCITLTEKEPQRHRTHPSQHGDHKSLSCPAWRLNPGLSRLADYARELEQSKTRIVAVCRVAAMHDKI